MFNLTKNLEWNNVFHSRDTMTILIKTLPITTLLITLMCATLHICFILCVIGFFNGITDRVQFNTDLLSSITGYLYTKDIFD
jgi:hypothetical protein